MNGYYQLIIKNTLPLVMVACLLSSCVGNPPVSNTPTPESAEVSFASLYNEFSCDQLLSEAGRLAAQMNQLAKNYGEDIDNNRMVFFGSVIYWPILLINDVNTDPTIVAEYDQLERRMRVLAKEKDRKNCIINDQ